MNPDVDLVILSKASTKVLYDITAHAITTAIMGAKDYRLNVIVLEQTDAVYLHATTIHAPQDFNYNRFLNRGARAGAAPWVVFANNDLTFSVGWLREMLAARYPVVSPVDPHNHRQVTVTDNETGYVVGRHFSGWCFMMSRSAYRKIGEFDERVKFWCSDDAVVQQCKAAGIAPMVVPKAKVLHHVSATLKDEPDKDDLMWAQVAEFNRLYGLHHGETNPRYLEWQQRQAKV